jgi:hypothetical protein
MRWVPTLAILATYLLHAVGLAHDARVYTHQGESLELNHRPFVWAIALVETATLASIAERAGAFAAPLRRWAFAALLVPVALVFYRGIQFQPRWSPPRIDYSTAYFDALDYVKLNAAAGEIVQATDLDPFLVTQAVSRRAPYVASSVFRLHPPPPVAVRAGEVTAWLDEQDPRRIEAFARQHRIAWVVESEKRRLRWPEEVIARFRVLQRDQASVFRFPP